jgi:hypothetical protein
VNLGRFAILKIRNPLAPSSRCDAATILATQVIVAE